MPTTNTKRIRKSADEESRPERERTGKAEPRTESLPRGPRTKFTSEPTGEQHAAHGPGQTPGRCPLARSGSSPLPSFERFARPAPGKPKSGWYHVAAPRPWRAARLF